MASSNKPLARHHPKVLWSRLKIRWPFLLWIILAAVFTLLMDHVSTDTAMPGVVEKIAEKVSSTKLGRVDRILVESGQRVEIGDVIAVLTSELVETQILEEQADIQTSLMQAEVENIRTSERYDQLIFSIESDIQSRELQLQTGQAEFQVLEGELSSLQPLIDDKLINPETLSNLRTRKETLARSVALYPANITQLKSRLDEARALKAAARASLDMEKFRGELERSSNLAALELERGGLTLKASRAGIVTEVMRQVGEVVQPGQTIATILDDDPTHVYALLAERRARTLEAGRVYVVYPDFDPDKMYEAKLTKIMPEIIGLTRAGTIMPDRTIRGRSLVFEIMDDHDLLPGESVTLRTDRSMLMNLKEKVSFLMPDSK
ncbi:MAG: multidrug resistance efflux pump [Kiritimatiellia bacterium]